MELDKKQQTSINTLLTKMTYVFTDFYIIATGYVLSMNKDKPFLIEINDDQVNLFKLLLGEFDILHILNSRDFKKAIVSYFELLDNKSDYSSEDEFISFCNICKSNIQLHYEIIESNLKKKEIINKLDEKLNILNSDIEWKSFRLSDDEETNSELMIDIFKNNNYNNFKPVDSDGPDIILTKSLLPLVNEKNYTDVCYTSSKVDDDLYLIIFDLDFSLFRLYMFHYYIPIESDE